MIQDTNNLDNELVSIDINSEEGMARIEEAKKLLPIHYSSLLNSIGGDLDDLIDYDRLPASISKMAELFKKEAPFLGEVSNVMTASLVYVNMYGKFRPYIQDAIVSKKTNIPANLFVVNIADSGTGKDASFTLGLEVLKEAEKVIEEARIIESENIAKATAKKLNKQAQQKEGIPDADTVIDDSGWEQYVKPISSGLFKSATVQGLLAEAEATEKSGSMGNLFIVISELGNALANDGNIDGLIQIMAEGYDTGKLPEDLVKTKELKVGSIEGLGMSLLAHTSPTPLMKNQKLVDKLKSIFGSYLGRRAYCTVTSLNDATSSIGLENNIDAQVEQMLNSVHSNIAEMDELSKDAVTGVTRILNGVDLEKITLTDDARRLYAKYYILNKSYRSLAYMKDENFVTEGLLPELINRHWRAVKLAAIWALAENTSVINAKLLASAIYFTEYVGKGLRTLMSSIDLMSHERFIKAIQDKEIVNSIRFDTMLKLAYIPRVEKNAVNTFLVTVNSALQGKAIVQADFEKSIVTVQVIESSTGEYGVSAIRFQPTDSKDYRKDKSFKGFKYNKYKLSDLTTLLKGDYAYSPFEFKDGRRSNDNIISETNWIIFDVDESELPLDTLHETYLSGTCHIIATTSDSSNMHKFRLILPIAQKIGADKQVYKYVMNRIAEELMLTIDPASTVLSQPIYSYSGGVVLDNLNENIEPMDISAFLSDAATKVQPVKYDTKLTKAQQTKQQQAFLHDFEDQFQYAINAKHGVGSIALWGAGKDMQRAGLDHTSIHTLLHKINSAWVTNGGSAMERSRIDNIANQFK